MKVAIDKSFPMPASADVAWTLLRDIERVAECMPGAKITERIDEQNFKGTVAVRFGPANMAFRGTVQLLSVDAASRTMHLVGKGTDTSGSSGATMDLNARIDAVDDTNCTLTGHSEVSMSGKAATFGGRMAGAVADQVLKQFAANFATQVQALQAAAVPATATAAAAAATDSPAPAAPPAAAPQQLNALALVWGMLKDWLRSLFGAKRT